MLAAKEQPQKSKMVLHVNDLHEEILLIILLRVRNLSEPGRLGDFISCLACCRRWHHIGTPNLWTDVVLDNGSISGFVSCSSMAKNGRFVRSLTIHITPEDAEQTPESGASSQQCVEDVETMTAQGSSKTRSLWGNLHDLSTTFKHMEHLTSFSLRVSRTVQERPVGFWIRQRELTEMVQALPENCGSLELDTYGHDRPTPGTDHLCASVRHRLPGFKHVRLRLALLCDSLFLERSNPGVADSGHQKDASRGNGTSLRTLVVGLTWGSPHTSTVLCAPSLDESDLFHRLPRLAPAFRSVVKAAHAAHEAGTFRAAERASIFDYAVRQDDEDQHEYETLNERDVLKSQSRRMPVQKVGPGPRSIMLRCIDAEGKEREVYGSFDQVYPIAEGPAFVTTSLGSRFPTELAKSVVSWDEGMFLEDANEDVEHRETFRKRSRHSSILWVREKQAGKTLLKVRTEPGLETTNAVREEIVEAD